MRKVSAVQIIVLIFCLGVTGTLIALQPMNNTPEKGIALESEILKLSDRYQITKNRLSPKVIEELKLDDYVFQTFTKNGVSLSLYVGYYFSGKKVGAAHDPQVCYPGQGWILSNKEKGHFKLRSGREIDYSSIVADLEGRKELIFYWFQVDDKTASNTFFQKMILFQKKMLRHDEGNAFVRISTPLNQESQQSAERYLFEFIDDFYPLFLRYVHID